MGANVTTIQDDNPQINYQPAGAWTIVNATRYSGGSIHHTMTKGAWLSYTFSGATDVALLTTFGSGRESVNIYLDGEYVGSPNLYAGNDTQFQQAVPIGTALSLAQHTVQIAYQSGNRESIQGNWFDLDAFGIWNTTKAPSTSPTSNETVFANSSGTSIGISSSQPQTDPSASLHFSESQASFVGSLTVISSSRLPTATDTNSLDITSDSASSDTYMTVTDAFASTNTKVDQAGGGLKSAPLLFVGVGLGGGLILVALLVCSVYLRSRRIVEPDSNYDFECGAPNDKHLKDEDPRYNMLTGIPIDDRSKWSLTNGR